MTIRDILTGATAIDVSAADATVQGAVYVGTQGDLKVDMKDGSTVTFVDAVGFMPIIVNKVYNSGTTATDILILK